MYPSQLCLTEGAKDECNVVEVVARNHDHQEIAVPVANLRLSCQPMVSSLAVPGRGKGGRGEEGRIGLDLPPCLSPSSVWMTSSFSLLSPSA